MTSESGPYHSIATFTSLSIVCDRVTVHVKITLLLVPIKRSSLNDTSTVGGGTITIKRQGHYITHLKLKSSLYTNNLT